MAIKRVLGIGEQVLKFVLVAAVVAWVADWAVFRMRASRGKGYDTVLVQEYLSTALKGNKQEYDFLGTEQVTCVRSLFPHEAMPACWWVRRHTTQWE